MGRNRYGWCSTCRKKIRSDNMKLHSHVKAVAVKYRIKRCHTCNKTMIAGHLARHLKTHDAQPAKEIKRAENNQRIFEKDKEIGRYLREKIISGRIDPDSLCREDKRAFEISREFPMMEHLALREWQKGLIPQLKADNRKIIWVVGAKGGEGKSWFQRYLLSVNGPKKVFEVDIKENDKAILHALSKQTTEIIELFIFNVPRNVCKEDIPYHLLEQIKDGRTLSTKYNSRILYFKSPNIVIVFSNETPRRSSMSDDRWIIYYIRNGNLELEK